MLFNIYITFPWQLHQDIAELLLQSLTCLQCHIHFSIKSDLQFQYLSRFVRFIKIWGKEVDKNASNYGSLTFSLIVRLTLIHLGTEKVLFAWYPSQHKFRGLLETFLFIHGPILIAPQRGVITMIKWRFPRAKNIASELAN